MRKKIVQNLESQDLSNFRTKAKDAILEFAGNDSDIKNSI
jgi:hypothetical protein